MTAVKPRRLLLDTNVWMAYFVGQEGVCSEATALVTECIAGGIELVYAPSTLKDVFYLLPRQLRRLNEQNGVAGLVEPASYKEAAWSCVDTMREFAVAASQTACECDLAHMLRSKYADLEDNLVMAAAETCGADLVVTYDAQMLRSFSPSCVTPPQALQAIRLWNARIPG